ncbi:MAG: hypothetical protein AAFR87_33315 [Bacteroidota bacterium]
MQALCYAKLKDFAAADSLLQKATTIDPNYHWHWGNILEMQGDREGAIFHYEWIISRDNSPITSYYLNSKSRLRDLKDPNVTLYKKIRFLQKKERGF